MSTETGWHGGSSVYNVSCAVQLTYDNVRLPCPDVSHK